MRSLRTDDYFDLQPVADGVYAAIARPRCKVNSNAAVILGDEGVLVVDTHATPSAARTLVSVIRSLTRQPVTHVVNTHFHWDHWQGNQVYTELFPRSEIITSQTTLENLTCERAVRGGLAYIRQQVADLPRELARLRRVSRLTPSRLPAAWHRPRVAAIGVRRAVAEVQAYVRELRALRPTLPTRTFKRTLSLDLGGRPVHLAVLGRAHTSGDVFVHLAQERVLVTGDCVIGWMPFLDDGYPLDWPGTLAKAERLDFARVIMGHGDVAGRGHVSLVRRYLEELVAAVRMGKAERIPPSAIEPDIIAHLAPRYEDGLSAVPGEAFRDRIRGHIRKVWCDLRSLARR